jgi:hypothetical protein
MASFRERILCHRRESRVGFRHVLSPFRHIAAVAPNFPTVECQAGLSHFHKGLSQLASCSAVPWLHCGTHLRGGIEQ